MAISRSGAVLGVYAFGDLFVYNIKQGNRIKPVRRVKDLLYINKDSYFKEGDIEVSQDGRWIAYSGRGEYVRFVNVHSGTIKNVPVRFNAVAAWSHALPGRGRFVSVAFDPKVRGGVWISTFSLLGKYGSDLRRPSGQIAVVLFSPMITC